MLESAGQIDAYETEVLAILLATAGNGMAPGDLDKWAKKVMSMEGAYLLTW